MSEETKTAAPTATDDAKRLAELLERKQKREKARDEQTAAFARKELELEDQFEEELGPRGEAFEIVNTPHDGPIAIRRGEPVLFKRFQASMPGDKDPTPEALHAFVSPCLIYPEKAVFNDIVGKRPQITMRMANALCTLMGAKESSDRGKF